MEATVSVTPYSVSTITCNGSITSSVDLGLYFRHVSVLTPEEAMGGVATGILCVKYGKGHFRGYHPKMSRAPATASDAVPVRNSFDNQVTTVFRVYSSRPEVLASYMPNVKLFRNGNVQMTGIRCPEDGERVLEMLADAVRLVCASGEDAVHVVDDIAAVRAREFRISMINTNFTVNYHVRRKALQRVLSSDAYRMVCSFEGPYPGVKLQYYWNALHGAEKQGICACTQACDGKGRGDGDGRCKKVTVSVFESGNALITGANAFAQVHDAYAFIRGALLGHANVLRKTLPLEGATSP